MAAQPTLAHYQALRRLRRMVLRSDSAVLLYLWGNDPRSLQWLRQQLDQALRARSRRALHWALVDEASFEAALAGVLAPLPGAQNFAAWVDLPANPANPANPADWSLADRWLARVNERRSQLLQWPRAVILAGPTALEARAGEVGPDLWSVRSGSFEVPAWAADDTDRPPTTPSAMPAPPATAGGRQVLPKVALWDEAVVAAGVRTPGAQHRLNLALGFDAVDEARRHRQLAVAERILLQTGREIDAAPPDGDTGAVRQLYQQRTLAGLLAADRRQLVLARQFHTDALALAQRLVALTGDSPGALRDWSISLDNVGDVERALGDVTGARGRYAQSLRVRERLVVLPGESPEALRDWSVSLNNVGDVERALGDVTGARGRFEQSLRVRERLVVLTGDSPEALRDWSISLIKVGDVERALGDVTGARGRYEQSLRVSERLVALMGEAPEALRDLAIGLQRLGDTHLALGDPLQARQHFTRSLAAAEAALRQSPLAQDLQNLVTTAQARLAALPPPSA